jgi:hypothetical protein
MTVGNLSMQHLNPERRQTVLGSDEHPKVTGDARRCDDGGLMVS